MTLLAGRQAVEAALVAHEDQVDWDAEIVLAGTEIAEDRPEEWKLEAWLPREPSAQDRAAVLGLFGNDNPELTIEPLEDEDWVAVSQADLEPIHAGRFVVRTPEHPTQEVPGTVEFVIPASQAFGTGHHETTAGCLAMLDAMKQRGVVVRNHLDVGTGTGLLAFAAMALWPRASATASDIDAVCADVVDENAAANAIPLGAKPGELVMTIAEGLDHPLIAARGPYDLVMANILAGPLVELAPGFGAALVPGGHLLLAGLLTTQEDAVRAACRRAGLRLAARIVSGDWSILWLRRRSRA
ncbi:50S ribosomal protein L11 methyltransferase [Novosphingobium sp. 9U]|uniref:50S ribosomal protein L11 methyltransferase n=1 Tax=Novosphingobium sp. 9U TaxID=2653158 RepID=UPI00135B1667|nr:50S ribosomal protein L11 methyltransferase [Novosphingobium sp. 9U]